MQWERESCGIYNFRFEWSRKAFLTEIPGGKRKYPLAAKLRRSEPNGAREWYSAGVVCRGRSAAGRAEPDSDAADARLLR